MFAETLGTVRESLMFLECVISEEKREEISGNEKIKIEVILRCGNLGKYGKKELNVCFFWG